MVGHVWQLRCVTVVSRHSDPFDSHIDRSRATHAEVSSAKPHVPPRHCEIHQSERAEAATGSTLTHPLEELMAGDAGIGAQKESEAPVNASLACSSGTVSPKSADCAPKSNRKALIDSALDSEPKQMQLFQNQGSSRSPETLAAHCCAGSDMDETVTKSTEHVESASGFHSDSRDQYDFVMWYHQEDDSAAERIYCFLEGDLNLKGYRYCRDETLGKYKLSEMVETIKGCRQVLLFITPQSKDCRIFENQMHNSMISSIESNRKNVIPIYWELNPQQGPNVVRGIYSIRYQDCNEKFKTQIARIFNLSYPKSCTTSVNSKSSSHQSVKSSVSQSLTQSSSVSQKSLWSRFFSSKK